MEKKFFKKETVIMSNYLQNEGITALAEVFKILYNVAQREHPEWFVAANDNRNNTSGIDTNGCNNELNKEASDD